MNLSFGSQFDNFEIEMRLPRVGNSDVYRARELTTDREVALKIPNQTYLADPILSERFRREQEAAQQLAHAAIQRYVKAGRFNETPFLATEFIEGPSLRTIIETEAPLPAERTIRIVREIAEGLAYCHEHGIVHRDIKPENVLVDVEDHPVIIDFGLVLIKGVHRATYSDSSFTSGTPDYIAPERLKGQRGDQRIDIYAIGIVLYEMLTGKPPSTIGDSFRRIVAAYNQPSRPGHPLISVPMAAIIAHCLQTAPADRYLDMRALINALDHPATEDTFILERTNLPRTSPFGWEPFTVIKLIVALVVILAVMAVLVGALHGR